MAVKYTDFPLKFLVLFILNHWRFNLPIMNKDPLYTPNNYSCKRAKPTSHQHFACVATRGVVESAHKTTEGVKSCWEQLHCPATSSGWWTTKKFLSSEFGKFEKCKTLSVIFHYLSKQRRVCVCLHVCVESSTPTDPENGHIGCISALFLVLPLWSLPSPNRSAELMEVFPDRLSSLVFASYWEKGQTLIKTWLDIKPPVWSLCVSPLRCSPGQRTCLKRSPLRLQTFVGPRWTLRRERSLRLFSY